MKKSMRVVLGTLFLLFFRKRTLTIMFIVLAIPAMIMTAYTLISNTLTEEAGYLYKTVEQGKNLFIAANTLRESINCTSLRLLYAKTMFKNKSLTSPIIIMDKEAYIKYTRYWPRKALEDNKTILVSIPSIYRTTYDLKLGEEITICRNNYCYGTRIDLIHRGQSILNSAIILVLVNETINDTYNTSREYCIISTSNNLVEKITTPLTKTLTMIQRETAILLTLAYFPIMLLGLKKIKKHMSREYRVLYEIGVSEKTLRINIALALMILGGLITTYGVFLATLIMHLSFWILRLYGIILVSRPLPEPATHFPYIALSMFLYFIAAIIVFSKNNGA